MPTLATQLLLTASFILVSSCSDKEAVINMSVSAKRLDGSPVALASVSLDGETIGETNAFGTFNIKTKTGANKSHTVGVSLDDPSYYYSPHQEKFQAHADRENDVQVRAIMYLAPKPKAGASVENKPLVASTQEAEANESIPTRKEASAAQPLTLLEVTPNDLFEVDDAASQEIEDRNGPIFTVHASSGSAPISGAQISWAENGQIYSSCATNERGRCILTLRADTAKEGSLLVRKPGYHSAIKNLAPKANQNIRLNLTPGSSFDVQVLSQTVDHYNPISGARFSGKNPLIATSDLNGYAIIPITGVNSSKLLLNIPGRQDPITIDIPLETDRIWPLRIVADSTPPRDTLLINNVHVPKHANPQVSSDQAERILSTLLAATDGLKAKTLPKNQIRLQPHQVAVIPVLSATTHGYKLKLIAVDTAEEQIWSTELAADFRFDDKLPIKIDGLVFDLKQRLAAYGIVEDCRRGELTIGMNSTQVKVGDQIVIRSELQTLDATITTVKEKHVFAKLATQQVKTPEWLIWGAQAIKQPRNAQNYASLRDIFSELEPIVPQPKSLASAKKFIAENNPKDALLALQVDESDDVATKILKFSASAQIKFNQHQSPEALISLYRALELSVASRFHAATNSLEININRVKADMAPVIAGDQQLIETLHELDGENIRLHKSADMPAPGVEARELVLQHAAAILRNKIADTDSKHNATKL